MRRLIIGCSAAALLLTGGALASSTAVQATTPPTVGWQLSSSHTNLSRETNLVKDGWRARKAARGSLAFMVERGSLHGS